MIAFEDITNKKCKSDFPFFFMIAVEDILNKNVRVTSLYIHNCFWRYDK